MNAPSSLSTFCTRILFGALFFALTGCQNKKPLAADNVQSFNEKGIMMFGGITAEGSPAAKDPSVIKFQGRYLMYYSVPSSKGWRVAIATSPDLVRWETLTTLEPAHPSEVNGFCAPAALVLGDTVHLFYQSYNNKEKAPWSRELAAQDAICHAWSKDGVHFVREPTNPIFRPHGAWTCGRAIDAEIIPIGDRLFLYFASRDPAQKIQLIGVAAAPLDSDFSRQRWTQLVDAPILKPELTWEDKCIEAPSIIRQGNKLYMFYAGAYNNWPQQIGVASSDDGITWKRLSSEPLLARGAPGTWNQSESGHPGIFRDSNGQTHLFFQGNNDRGKSWYLSKVKIGWNEAGPFVDYAP
jgi:predicted GH43/DUF377 family glycosyl hydrolase